MKTPKFQQAEWNTNTTTRKLHWRDSSRLKSKSCIIANLVPRAFPWARGCIIAYTNSWDSSFRAASACRITRFGRVCEFVFPPFVSATSPKCIDREGLGRNRTRARQELDNTPWTYYNKAAYYPCRPKRTQTLEIEWDLHYLLSRDRTQVPIVDAWRYWDDHVRMRTSAL